MREQGLFWKPDPPLYDRRPGLVCESGAVSTWKFEHQPEGEGDLLAFFFSRQYELGFWIIILAEIERMD